MADVRPFAALRPPAELASRVACPPYDVVSTAEARALAAGNDASFLHVTRPEIDLPEGTDEHADAVHDRGRKNLEAMVEAGWLLRDPEPRLYVYAQRMGAHRQVGVVGCASVAEYDAGKIKKHENTRADKEDDRTRHIDALSAHDEPVFLTYRASKQVDALVRAAQQATPVYDFTAPDGVGHQLWVLGGEASRLLAQTFEAVPALYVADGHHRSAAASRVHAARRGDGGEHHTFMAVLFPHDQMQIMAYNRVVRDPAKRPSADLIAALRERMDLAAAAAPAPEKEKTFGVYAGGAWYTATPRAGSFDAEDPVASLDCSICQDQILEPIFGVRDPRRDAHVEFVGGIRGAAELERRVDSGEMDVALYLHPTSIQQLMAVSDRGLLMPPKSTWFEPKLRSGLFVHAF